MTMKPVCASNESFQLQQKQFLWKLKAFHSSPLGFRVPGGAAVFGLLFAFF